MLKPGEHHDDGRAHDGSLTGPVSENQGQRVDYKFDERAAKARKLLVELPSAIEEFLLVSKVDGVDPRNVATLDLIIQHLSAARSLACPI